MSEAQRLFSDGAPETVGLASGASWALCTWSLWLRRPFVCTTRRGLEAREDFRQDRQEASKEIALEGCEATAYGRLMGG